RPPRLLVLSSSRGACSLPGSMSKPCADRRVPFCAIRKLCHDLGRTKDPPPPGPVMSCAPRDQVTQARVHWTSPTVKLSRCPAESAGEGSRPDLCRPDHGALAYPLTAMPDSIRRHPRDRGADAHLHAILRSDASARWGSEVWTLCRRRLAPPRRCPVTSAPALLTHRVHQTYRVLFS